ncbi:hypothetical protein ACA910_001473 [Epithemia clementina (nom. ined.)]
MLTTHEDLELMSQLIAMDTETTAPLPDDESMSMTAILPLDFAFEALPPTLLTNLLSSSSSNNTSDWHAHRCDLVQYHCSLTHLPVSTQGSTSSSSRSTSLPGKSTQVTLTMLNQKTVTVTIPSGDKIQFNGISVISMDEFDNGAIYTIGQLLPRPWYVSTVLDIAGNRNVEFKQLVIAAGMEDTFRNESQAMTVFVPSKNALNTIVSWATEEHLQRIVKYHMILDSILALNNQQLPLGRTVVTNALRYSLTIDNIPVNNSVDSSPTNIVTIQGQELLLSNQHLALNGIVHFLPEILRSDFVPPETTA